MLLKRQRFGLPQLRTFMMVQVPRDILIHPVAVRRASGKEDAIKTISRAIRDHDDGRRGNQVDRGTAQSGR
jgi:hypothetical protein